MGRLSASHAFFSSSASRPSVISIDIAATARGVLPANAIAWWTDFQEGKSDHRLARRRILDRGADGSVTMEDRSLFFRERLTAWTDGNVVRFRGENSFVRFEGSYTFEQVAEGTSIRLQASLRLRGGWRPFQPAARPIARAVLRADLRLHARELNEQLAGHR